MGVRGITGRIGRYSVSFFLFTMIGRPKNLEVSSRNATFPWKEHPDVTIRP